jgi:hypothetical protein
MLTRQVIGGKISRWIVILQEIDLDFVSAKSKKSVFVELISELPVESGDVIPEESPIQGDMFLITSSVPWYEDILIYLQTMKCPTSSSRDDHRCICHQAKNYLIIDDTLYRRGVHCILRRCLTHEEAVIVLNDFHTKAYGGHFSGLETTQKILRAGYFWPTLIKDCIKSVEKCHLCQIFSQKMRAHPAPMFPVITVGPFTKWGIDYTTCNPPSAKGHRYIIVAVDYFTKWVEAMPMFKYDGKTGALFLFNQIIARFDVPREIVTDHGSHFQNQMMTELTSNLGLRQDHSSPYYPQANGQVKVVKKTLKTILWRTINSAKSNWHLMLYSALWAYRIYVKTATNFSPFQLVYGLEAVFPIECQIPSLKLAVQLLPDTSPLEEQLVYLEQCHDAALASEAHKHKVKCQYDMSIHPRIFSEGELVLVYD